MKTVCLVPHWDTWNNDRLFADAEGCVYTEAFSAWRKEAAGHGLQLISPAEPPHQPPDVLWFIDLPKDKATFLRWFRRWPQRPRTVLHIMESPLLFPHAFHPANRRLFDAIVSYESHSTTAPWFHCPLPVASHPTPPCEIPFDQRKLAVMVNTNRYEGWLATRKPGLAGLPGIGRIFSGWHMPLSNILYPAAGELYSWRRRLARTAASLQRSSLDIFGSGWNGEKISWCRALNRSPYLGACPSGPPLSADQRNLTKRALLANYRFTIATENFRGYRGYVSEKIFDALLASSVPVYLGEEAISHVIPSECFIDARDFPSITALWHHLTSMNQSAWQDHLEAARHFLSSEAFIPFTVSSFSSRLTTILKSIIALP